MYSGSIPDGASIHACPCAAATILRGTRRRSALPRGVCSLVADLRSGLSAVGGLVPAPPNLSRWTVPPSTQCLCAAATDLRGIRRRSALPRGVCSLVADLRSGLSAVGGLVPTPPNLSRWTVPPSTQYLCAAATDLRGTRRRSALPRGVCSLVAERDVPGEAQRHLARTDAVAADNCTGCGSSVSIACGVPGTVPRSARHSSGHGAPRHAHANAHADPPRGRGARGSQLAYGARRAR